MKLFFTRHGQTNSNVEEWVCGMTNAMLTEQGRQQAEELAKVLQEQQHDNKIEYIYVSPLQRARDTAAPIEKALGLKAIVDDRLHEVNFGLFEGRHYLESDVVACRKEYFTRYPEGESEFQVAQRIYNIIDEVKEERKGHNVLFVSHGAVSRIFKSYFEDIKLEDYPHAIIGNCQLLKYEL